MITIGESRRVRFGYEVEAALGVVNSPFAAQTIRETGASISLSKETIRSAERRADRMKGQIIEVSRTSGFDWPFAWSLGTTFDEMIEAVTCGTYQTIIDETGALTATAATNTLDSGAAGAFTNVLVGQAIYVTGCVESGNNGWHTIATIVDADEVTVDTTSTLVNETTPAGTRVYSKCVRNGVIKRSFNFEQYQTDEDTAWLLLAQRANTLSGSISAGAPVSGNLGFIGGTASAKTGSSDYASTVAAVTTTDILNATGNVATILINDVATTCQLRSLEYNLTNEIEALNAAGSTYPCAIAYGDQMIDGTFSVMNQDLAFHTLFDGHTAFAIKTALTDTAGNSVHKYFPACRISTYDVDPNSDKAVLESIGWGAEPATVGSATFQVQFCFAPAA